MSRVYTTAIDIGAKIAKSFKSDTLGAAAALTKLTGAAKKLEEAKKAAASYKMLNEVVSKSKAKYDQASAALRRLDAAEKAAGGATKESTKWRKAGERELAKYAREMDRATHAAEKNARAMRSIPHLRMAAARERLFGEKKGGAPVPLMQKAGGQVRGIASDAMWLGGAAVGVGAGLGALVIKIGNAGDAAAKMAKRIGVGVEALQELRYAGEREGASAEEVDKSLGKLMINVGKFKNAKGGKGGGGGGLSIPGVQMLGGASAGAGAAAGEADPFKRIGLDAKKLALLKPDQVIENIADGLGKLKTDADRSAVAVAIFGKGGLALVPMLKGGSAGMAQLRKEARDLGHVMSEDSAAKAEEFNDRMLDAELAAKGMANTLGVALLPVVTKTFSQFTNWVKTNRVEIKAWVENAAKWIETKGIPAIMKIGTEVASFAAKVAGLVNGAAKLVGGFDNLAIAMAVGRFAPLISTLGQIGIEGLKAAAAIFQLAAANQAVGGGPGGFLGGKFGGTGAALGIGGAILGAGLYGIKKFEQAGEERNDALENAGVGEHAHRLMLQKKSRLARIAQLEKGGMTHGQAVFAASQPRTGGGAQVTSSPTIVVNPGAARGDVKKALDEGSRRAMDAYDARLSFSE